MSLSIRPRRLLDPKWFDMDNVEDNANGNGNAFCLIVWALIVKLSIVLHCNETLSFA